MRFISGIALLLLLFPLFVEAQELHSDIQGIWRAKVVVAVPLGEREIPGTDTKAPVQRLTAEILEGERIGERVTFENDFTQLEVGDAFFMNYLVTVDGAEIYSVREPDRRWVLVLLSILFAGALIVVARGTGFRAILALAGSLILIGGGLLPLLLQGFNPLLTSIAFSLIILGTAMGITHGISRMTLLAFAGSALTVVVAAGLGALAVSLSRISGFIADESVFVNFSTSGALDFSGLFLGAVLIGALGVLDDVAITQASAVEELWGVSRGEINRHDLYRRAMRIGRAHIGAMVNTLALAYVGSSLPLLLLFSLSEMPTTFILNQEVFAAEIIRTTVGSIALVLTVPITTFIALRIMKRSQI